MNLSTPRTRTVGGHSFARIPDIRIPRSSFRQDHSHETTFDAGKLIPHNVTEVLPGDTLNVSVSHIIRMSTLLHPLLDNIHLDWFWFFVPSRLVWDNWQRFMGERDPDPDSSVDYLVPTLPMYDPIGAVTQSLPDYMGIPTYVPGLVVNALPFRAYNLIWNEWFRDQNLQDSVDVPKGDGPDLPTQYDVLRRGKRHDYFTSCLPWPQKGDAVTIGIGATAPVTLDTQSAFGATGTGTAPTFDLGGAVRNLTGGGSVTNTDWSANVTGSQTADWDDPQVEVDISGALGTADLSAATAVTINNLRSATAIQRLLEKDARGGTRYTEMVRTHFGVTSPDQRLQRPEYLGGGSTQIIYSTVPNASGTGTQGELASFGVGIASKQYGFAQSFTEHGYVIGLVAARADLRYQQGLERFWTRRDRLDFYIPALASLGEQAVTNVEIYAQGPAAAGDPDADVFGYQERWAEYRYRPSRVSGAMRSNTPGGGLDVWHLTQDFASLPVLDSPFIEDDPPIDRVIATPTEPHFFGDIHNHVIHVRPMPTHSIPGLTDRF